MTTHKDYSIAWICALPVEVAAARSMLDRTHTSLPPPSTDPNAYELGELNGHYIVIACLPVGIYGTVSATSVISHIRSTFPRLRYGLMVGIGGGVPGKNNDIRLGDVVVSKPVGRHSGVIQYDYGKAIQDGQFEPTGTLNKPPQALLTHIGQLEAKQMREGDDALFKLVEESLAQNPNMQKQFSPPEQHTDFLFHSSYPHSAGEDTCEKCDKEQLITRQPRGTKTPYIHYGLIASGDQVMKDSKRRDRLAQQHGILCFEMEAAGIMDELPTLVIRGICDYCDSHKQKQWQGYAALTAAAFAKFLLSVVPGTAPRMQPECMIDKFTDTQIFEARKTLEDHYRKQLKIERLSGKELPMEDCYINLAVVGREQLAKNETYEQSKGITDQQTSPFSLLKRLKVEAAGSGSLVTLDDLFEPRKQPDGEVRAPKRILIQGSAGVGKTTLCKKIVHDYFHRQMWQQRFSWLLWVPLRRLKLKSSEKEYNLGDLFYNEYFSRHREGKDFSLAVWEAVDKIARDKTLFILDGLDEVSGEWEPGTPMHRLLRDLLEMPQVIITTRPYRLSRTDLGPLDLELETIGFLPNQVTAYVENPKIVERREIAKQIQNFIQNHDIIRGLVRIPIQLDALCYTWNTDFPGDMARTMTTIYKAIVLKLWLKDIRVLEIRYQGELLKERDVHDLSESTINTLIQNETRLINVLAFTGLYSDVIEFRAEIRKQIYNHQILYEKIPERPDLILKKLSFLRTADETLGDDVRSYHFLHLTFQEFFAAQYFVCHWVEDKDVLCFPFQQAGMKPFRKRPEKFLQEEKYNSRYDIFWRFVAGLLHEQSEKQLIRFFNVLDDKPRDLLGPSHLRILLHCFSEVPSTSLRDLRPPLEEQSKQWALFEQKIHGRMTICHEIEFPEHVLSLMIKEESNDVKYTTLQALQHRPRLSGHLLRWVADFMGDRFVVFNILRNQPTLPENIVQAIVAQLEDSDRFVRRSAIHILEKQSSLSENIIQAIMARLEHSDEDMRMSAIRVLEKQSPLSENIIQAIMARLEHSDKDVRRFAIGVLEKLSLSKNIVQAIVARLEDPDEDVRRSAINALEKQSSLSENIVQAIITRLEHSNRYVRISAINALEKQSPLSENIVQAIVGRLEDPNEDVRRSAINALEKQSSLSKNIVQAIMARLEHSDKDVRMSVIFILNKQTPLSENIVQAIITRLEGSDRFVRRFAIGVLEKLSLSENIFQAVMAQLEDYDRFVRRSAIDALEKLSLSENIVQAIMARLEHFDEDVRMSAIHVLEKQSSLSENIVQAIVARLEDPDKDVRRSAIIALEKQSPLSENIVQAIVAQLEDSDRFMRWSAIKTLEKQSPLSENIVQAIVAQLEDSDRFVRISAINALEKQSPLSENIVQAIVAQLEDSDRFVRRSAIGALEKQPSLSENTVQALATLLSKAPSSTISEAVGVLLRQDNFYTSFQKFDRKMLRSVYKILVQQSFREQVSCYIQDEILYIDMPYRRREISLTPKNDEVIPALRRRMISLVLNQNIFLDAFREEASTLGRPMSLADDLIFTVTPWHMSLYLIMALCFFIFVLLSLADN